MEARYGSVCLITPYIWEVGRVAGASLKFSGTTE